MREFLSAAWRAVKTAALWALSFVWGIFRKKLVEAPILTIVSILFPTWFAATVLTKGPEAATPFGDRPGQNEIERLTNRNDSLLNEVHTVTVRTQAQLEDMARAFLQEKERRSQAERELALQIREANRKGDRLLAISEGAGTVEHEGGGPSDSVGSFQDPWIIARIQKNNSPLFGQGPFDLRYRFTFGVADVSATLRETATGAQYDIYTIFLRSTTDTTETIALGNYRKERRAVDVRTEPTAQRSAGFRTELSINGDAVFGGSEGVELGVSISPFALGGGSGENETWARFPEIGASSELKTSSHLFAGIRLNAGAILPLFRDLYLSPKYGLGLGRSPSGILIGIGTTL